MSTNATIDGRSETELLGVVQREIAKKTKKSRILSDGAEDHVTKFDLSEISVGIILGKGGFCDVKDVTKITLNSCFVDPATQRRETEEKKDESTFKSFTRKLSSAFSSTRSSIGSSSDNNNNYMDDILAADRDGVIHVREYMASNYNTIEGQHQYAIKLIQKSARDNAESYIRSVMDLALEARYLAVLRHAHIIQMRAMAATSPYESGHDFFLILEKLSHTLTARLESWKQRITQKNAFWLSSCPSCCCLKRPTVANRHPKNDEQEFWTERLLVAHDLSTALAYLHQHKIIYRDVKTDNIGFDIRGDVKFFDFGLAREMQRKHVTVEGTYHLTGGTGCPPYIAPEVALDKPYNETCDVYSFCILLFQILKVEPPFDNELVYDEDAFHKCVIMGGERPVMDSAWPAELRSCMRLGWAEDLHIRPSMDDMTCMLQTVLAEETGESERASLLEFSRLLAEKYI